MTLLKLSEIVLENYFKPITYFDNISVKTCILLKKLNEFHVDIINDYRNT